MWRPRACWTRRSSKDGPLEWLRSGLISRRGYGMGVIAGGEEEDEEAIEGEEDIGEGADTGDTEDVEDGGEDMEGTEGEADGEDTEAAMAMEVIPIEHHNKRLDSIQSIELFNTVCFVMIQPLSLYHTVICCICSKLY